MKYKRLETRPDHTDLSGPRGLTDTGEGEGIAARARRPRYCQACGQAPPVRQDERGRWVCNKPAHRAQAVASSLTSSGKA